MTFLRQPAWKSRQYLAKGQAFFKRNDKPPSLQSKREWPDVPQTYPRYNNIQQSNEHFLDF